MISRNRRYRLTHISHHVFGEYRLIFADETVCQLSWDIVGRYNALNSGYLPRA
jgi:hypothetical protein